MKKIIILMAAALLASCTQQPSTPTEQQGIKRGEIFSGAPPERFRGDVQTRIMFVENVAEACYDMGLTKFPNTVVLACTATLTYTDGRKESMIVLKNPCIDDPEGSLCHEIGHVNSWSKYHET